jgi:hypothetical protein
MSSCILAPFQKYFLEILDGSVGTENATGAVFPRLCRGESLTAALIGGAINRR